MGRENFKRWYLTRPEAISKYLFSIFTSWGYFVCWNQSDDSESLYLKVCLGTRKEQKTLHIRISDHSVQLKNCWVKFNVDLYCGYEREGATSYIKLLTKLAGELNKPLPAYLGKVKAGTIPYKRYRIEMQCRRKWARRNGRSLAGDRLYV